MGYLYKIYTLTDPRTDLVFYVGMVDSTLNSRLSQHVGDCQILRTEKDKFIFQMIKEGFAPVISLIEEVSENRKQALSEEQKWIFYYLNRGYNLLNIRGNPLRKQKKRISKRFNIL